jgi:hypothetical protein
MLHYIELRFENRKEPLVVPVAEKESERVKGLFDNRTDKLDGLNFTSVTEQDLWVNATRLTSVRFCYDETDSPPFDPGEIGESEYFADDEKLAESSFEKGWGIELWIAGQERRLTLADAHGHDWVTISACGFQQEEEWLLVPDAQPDFGMAIRYEQIDMACGTEMARYNDRQWESLANLIKPSPQDRPDR